MATRPLRVSAPSLPAVCPLTLADVFPNGQLSGGKALLVPASWSDFLAAAAGKLKVAPSGARIFTAEGGELGELDELLAEDQLFVVEHGDDFRTPGSGPRPAPRPDPAAEETEPIDPLAARPTSSAHRADANTSAASVAPPPVAHAPRAALPLVVGSASETRRALFLLQEPQLLRVQSLMPGVALAEVLTALSLADNDVPAALRMLARAHPTLPPPSEDDLRVAPAHSRARFDASILAKTPTAPRVRARADFSAVEQNVRDVVGPRFSQGEIRNAVRAANGNAETAILQLLNQDIP